VLYEALVAQDLSPKIQYPVAGRRLDMALIREGDDPLKLDIEVDGDRYHRNPDGSRKQADIWRDYQLRGLGWKIKRFWVYQLREDLQKCVNSILEIWRHPNDSGQQ
jgi:very-short-patch-repair endonuclease